MGTSMKVGILGGTGLEGKGLALRFAQAGFSVAIGSRSREKAQVTARELSTESERALFTGDENRAVAVSAELLLICTPFASAGDLLRQCRGSFRAESVVVDVTVPLEFVDGAARLVHLEEGSGSEHLAPLLPPGIPLVAAFKTLPARLLANLGSELDCDEFFCGDSRHAKAQVMAAAAQIPGLRPIDAGPLFEARTLERMTALALRINRAYRVKETRFRVVGV